MAKWRNALSIFFYWTALAISIGGTGWVIYMHMGLWMKGKFFIGSVSGILVIEYVVVSIVPWLIGRFLCKRPLWDRVFYVVSVVPFLMLLLPGKFYLGDQ